MQIQRFDFSSLATIIERSVASTFGGDALTVPVSLLDLTTEFTGLEKTYGIKPNPGFVNSHADVYKRYLAYYVRNAPLSELTRGALLGSELSNSATQLVVGLFSSEPKAEITAFDYRIPLFSQLDTLGLDDIITEPNSIVFEDQNTSGLTALLQRSNKDYLTLICGEIYRRSAILRKFVTVDNRKLLPLVDGAVSSASVTFMHSRIVLERTKDKPSMLQRASDFMTRTSRVHMSVWERQLNRVSKENLRKYLDAQFILFRGAVEDAVASQTRGVSGLKLTASGWYALSDVVEALNIILK